VDAPKPPTLETVQGNVHDGQANYLDVDLTAAHALLAPLRAPGEAGIRRHEAWRTSPVEPRPDLDEDFPPYATVDELLQHARAQQPADCPDHLWTPFATARGHVQGEVDDIATAKKALEAEMALTAKQCARPESYRAENRWPRHVQDIANDLGRLANRTDDTLDDHAHWLAVALQVVLGWSRGRKAQAAPPPAETMRPGTLAAPDSGATRWNPFDYPTR